MKNINFPNLRKDQLALVQIEASTGITLNTSGNYLLKDSEDKKFLIFQTIEAALAFIEKQERENIEYFILNYKEEILHHKVIHKDKKLLSTNKQRRSWWKFWML